jgi:predicted DCC family thiol-disulfide oxidoreductase YuxK
MPTDIIPARESSLPPRVVRVTVWHDGGCPLCAHEIALMRGLDRRGAIAFVDVSEPSAVCPRSRSELLARFHAREEGPLGSGPLLSGAAAFAAMWRAIPLLRPLGLLARNAVVLGLLERLYLRFLVVRPRLQHWLVRRQARA